MKTIILIMSLLIAALTFLGISTVNAIPPECDGLTDLEERIECSIEEGLDWLVGQQNPATGDFGYVPIATTGLACVKLADRGKELAKSNPDIDGPFDADYEYSDELQKALDYIFGYAFVSGDMIFFPGLDTYSTGIAAMCVAATEAPDRVVVGGPLDGKTYQEVLQGMVDWLVFAQNDGGCEIGGWGYIANDIGWSDNSNSGYASLGLGFAQSLFGMDISAITPGLDTFIDNVQDTTGGLYDGGSDYLSCSVWDWKNILKTGNLLYELGLVGEGVGDDRVDRAVDFIETYWNAAAGWYNGAGWIGDLQAMFTMMKGLEALGIDELDTGSGPFDWFEVVATYIVDNQNDDGSWLDTDVEGTPAVIDTAWALLTLEKVVPEITKTVPVDIKPLSCPNPLNPKDKGVIPVAISSTTDFDATQVDPATVKLAGVSPLRWSYEDVATPFEPFTGKENCTMDCTTAGADGMMDLSLKFDAQTVVTALGELQDNQCIVVNLTGNLKEEFGSTPIVGEDVMIVRTK